MSRFHARGGGASAKFSLGEAAILAGLARQVAGVIAGRADTAGDPVLDRLFPSAYPDNDEFSSEFRRFTEDELGDEKVRNALALANSLEPKPDKVKVRVTLDAEDALVWLRALNDIRLALGTRLGLDDEGEPTVEGDDADFTVAVYDWLGGLQQSLVTVVDA
ncbi:MAG: hypothetical protein JWR36_713 [Glaciihabitans sp.]|nr:hypothetical protein [Glaciihabitans sp.]MDQ1570733.1 hypothetical protein [Actinomycetota bacterium]